ncbi:MAG: hypothetical protein ACLRT5_05015 [Lachnospiraceae bacterium]
MPQLAVRHQETLSAATKEEARATHTLEDCARTLRRVEEAMKTFGEIRKARETVTRQEGVWKQAVQKAEQARQKNQEFLRQEVQWRQQGGARFPRRRRLLSGGRPWHSGKGNGPGAGKSPRHATGSEGAAGKGGAGPEGVFHCQRCL